MLVGMKKKMKNKSYQQQSNIDTHKHIHMIISQKIAPFESEYWCWCAFLINNYL